MSDLVFSLRESVRAAVRGLRVRGLYFILLLSVIAWVLSYQTKTAYSVGTGLEYQLGQGTIGILYSLERYDFPAQAMVQRLEQVSALTVRGALRVGH